MIWADRAGVGLAATVLVAFGMLYAGGAIQHPEQPHPAWVYPKRVGDPPGSVSFEEAAGKPPVGVYLTDAEVGLDPERGQKANLVDIAYLAGRFIAFGALPAWLLFRIVDFVLGGHERRKARRLRHP